jgi:glycosyltransferase involved in cell wall biosynthesis
MSDVTISVIIPIYKTEAYLRKCLDSVAGQTYQNLEIVLVENGSPDNCGAICDEYAAADARVRVIHKEHGSPSSARNAGLAAATGEWIGWVDSDDWLELDMFQYLLENALAHSADIAVCGHFMEYPGRSVFHGMERERLLNTEEALELLLQDKVLWSYVWDKLCRRELYDGVCFSEVRGYEDVTVMYRLFERAERVIGLPEGKYHYFQRPDSVVHDRSLQKKLDFYRERRKRLRDMEQRWPQFRKRLEVSCAVTSVGVWRCYYAAPKELRQELRPELEEIAAFMRQHGRDAADYADMGVAGRVVMRLACYATWWSFALAYGISLAAQWKHRLVQ